jgi:hypothetical protein
VGKRSLGMQGVWRKILVTFGTGNLSNEAVIRPSGEVPAKYDFCAGASHLASCTNKLPTRYRWHSWSLPANVGELDLISPATPSRI